MRIVRILVALIATQTFIASAHADGPSAGELDPVWLQTNDQARFRTPICVGIRGNGPRLWAHYSSIANIVETSDGKLLTYENSGTGLGLAGCTPGVE